MAQKLNITSTRNSPYNLEDIGLCDGDLITIKALAAEIAQTEGLLADDFVPVSWIREYAKNNGSEISEVLDCMLKEYRSAP